jgi:hypothetical protein
MTKNDWLVLVFCVYAGALFCFAATYYYIYSKRPDSFAFGGDIRARQLQSVLESKLTEERTSKFRLKYLPELLAKLKEGNSTPAFFKPSGLMDVARTLYTTENFNFSLVYYVARGGPHGGYIPAQLWLAVENKSGRHLDEIDVIDYVHCDGPIKSIPKWIEMAHNFEHATKEQVESLQGEIISLSQRNPKIWSFWDFVYFSTITQGTVGYGDILPNSTLVRMIVTVQTILTVVLLVVVLNLSLSNWK